MFGQYVNLDFDEIKVYQRLSEANTNFTIMILKINLSIIIDALPYNTYTTAYKYAGE